MDVNDGGLILWTCRKAWKKLKKHISSIDLEVEAIEQLIHELNEIDNDGVTFRYDYELNHLVRNKDQKTLNELIDVNALRIRMLQLYRFFDGIDDEARIFHENNKKGWKHITYNSILWTTP